LNHRIHRLWEGIKGENAEGQARKKKGYGKRGNPSFQMAEKSVGGTAHATLFGDGGKKKKAGGDLG